MRVAMTKSHRAGLVFGVLLVVTAGQVPAQSERAERLILMSGDQVFMGELRSRWLRGPMVELTKFPPSQFGQPVRNLRDVSVAGPRMVLVGVDPPSDRFVIAVLDIPSASVEARLWETARHAALSQSARLVAYTAYPGRSQLQSDLVCKNEDLCVDLRVWDLTTRTSTPLVKGQVRFRSQLSWRAQDAELTYDAGDGWIYSVRVADGHRTQLVQGTSPSWSPDRSTLAFVRGQSVWLYDPVAKVEKRIYAHRSLTSELETGLYWNTAGATLALNLGTATLSGYEYLKCVVLDIASGKTKEVNKGDLSETFARCGPWAEISIPGK